MPQVLKQSLAEGLYGDLGLDDITAILEEAGKFRRRADRAAQPPRATARAPIFTTAT